MKYEYKFVTHPAFSEKFLEWLNQHGQEGWRIVQIERKHIGERPDIGWLEEVLLERGRLKRNKMKTPSEQLKESLEEFDKLPLEDDFGTDEHLDTRAREQIKHFLTTHTIKLLEAEKARLEGMMKEYQAKYTKSLITPKLGTEMIGCGSGQN